MIQDRYQPNENKIEMTVIFAEVWDVLTMTQLTIYLGIRVHCVHERLLFTNLLRLVWVDILVDSKTYGNYAVIVITVARIVI